VLQVVFVAALPKFDFGNLGSVFCEHDVFLRVACWSLLRLVESGEKFATVFDLTVSGSFELDRHSRNTAAVNQKLQVFI